MKKMTPQQRARLGGLARAQKLTAEQRREIASKGGQAFIEKHGIAGAYRNGLRRQGVKA